MDVPHPPLKRSVRAPGQNLHRYTWRCAHHENGRGGIFHCAVSRRRQTDTAQLFRGMLRRRRHYSLQFFTHKAPSDVERLVPSSHTTICASLLDAAADVDVDVFAAVDTTTLSSTFLHPYCTTSPWLPEKNPEQSLDVFKIGFRQQKLESQ